MAALEGEEQRMADGEKKRFDNFAGLSYLTLNV